MADLAQLTLSIDTSDVAKAKRDFQDLLTEGTKLERGVASVGAQFSETGRESSRLATELSRTESTTDASKRAWNDLVNTTTAVDASNEEVADSTKRVEEATRHGGDAMEEAGHKAGLLGSGLHEVTHLVRDLFAAFALYRIVEEAKEALFEFDEETAKLRGTVRATITDLDAQTDALGRLEEASVKMGTSTRFSAGEASGAYEKLISSGFDLETSIAAANGAMELAEARSLDLGQATDITARLLKAYGAEAATVETTLDQLTLASLRTPGGIQRISDALVQLGPIASSLNIPLSDIIGSVTVLSQLPGGQRGVGALRELIFGLVNPSEKAAEKIHALEEQVGSLDPRTNRLADVILRLRDANLELEDATDLFNKRAAAGILLLIENADKIKEWSDENERAVGVTHKLAEENDRNLGESFHKLKNTIESVLITGNGFSNWLREIVDHGINVVKQLAGLNDVMAEEDHVASGVADALQLVGTALKYLVPTVLAVQLAQVVGGLLETKTILGALYALAAAHPFLAVAGAVGLLAGALVAFRPEVISAREELEALNDAVDFEGWEQAVKRIDDVTAALQRAKEAGDTRRELNLNRTQADILEGLAVDAQTRVNKFGEGAVEPTKQFEETLEKIGKNLGVEVEIKFKEDVIERDARAIGQKIQDKIVEQLKEGHGDLTPGGTFGALELPEAAFSRAAREKALRQFLPEGRFEVQAVSPEDASRFFRGIEDAIKPFKKELEDALDVGDSAGIERLSASIRARLGEVVREFLAGQKQISVGSSAAIAELDELAKAARERIKELEEELAREKPKLAPTSEEDFGLTGGDEGGGASDAKKRREAVQEALSGLREQTEERKAALGLEGPEAAAAIRRVQFERLLTEAEIKDKDAIAAKRAEFEKLNQELLQNDSAKADAKIKLPDFGDSAGKTAGAFRTILDAQLASAEATLKQGASLGDFVEHLQAERRELELTMGLDNEKAQQVRELIQLETLLKNASGLDEGTKSAVFEQASQEIEALKELRTQKREAAVAARGEGAATKDTIDERLEEAQAILKQRGSVEQLLTTLHNERETREKKLGLTAEEVEAYDRLAKVEGVLAEAAQLTGKEREDALATAQTEIDKLVELRRQEEALAESRANEKAQRTDVGRAVDQFREENSRIQDQIDLIDARSQKERDEIALRISARRSDPGVDPEIHSLKDLIALLDGEIIRRLRLQDLLTDKEAGKSAAEDRVRSARQENNELEQQIELLRARSAAERASIGAKVQAPGQNKDLKDASQAELNQKLEDELRLRESLAAEVRLIERSQDVKSETRELVTQQRLREQEVESIRNVNELMAQGVDPLGEQVRLGREAFDQERERVQVASELREVFVDFAKGGLDFKVDGVDGVIRKLKELGQLVAQIFGRSKLRLDIDAEETNKQFEETIQKIREEKLALTQTNEEREVSTRLRGMEGKLSDDQINQIREEVHQLEQLRRVAEVGRDIGQAFSDGLRQIAFEGAKWEDAMKGFLQRVLQAFAEATFFRPLENSIATGFTNLFSGLGGATGPGVGGDLTSGLQGGLPGGFAEGAMFPFAGVQAFADGAEFKQGTQALLDERSPFAMRSASGNPFINRVVDKPTIAPLAMFGEAGPEAIVPLRDHGDGLGVSAYLGGVETTSAPLRRGVDGRLGIDLGALLAKLEDETRDKARPDPKRDERAYGRGDTFFQTSTTNVEHRFAAGDVFHGSTFGAQTWSASEHRFASGDVFNAPTRSALNVEHRFAAGDVFHGGASTRTNVEHRFASGDVFNSVEVRRFEQGDALFAPWTLSDAPNEPPSLEAAGAAPATIGSGSGAPAQPIVYNQQSHYHFHGNQRPDDAFRKSARMNETDLRDGFRRVFARR